MKGKLDMDTLWNAVLQYWPTNRNVNVSLYVGKKYMLLSSTLNCRKHIKIFGSESTNRIYENVNQVLYKNFKVIR
jgi:hypothetical protein